VTSNQRQAEDENRAQNENPAQNENTTHADESDPDDKSDPDDRGNDPVFVERYRAISARDARFDGQFIVGVHSTGIYCRPSCPAVTPRAENVSFYLTSAAAHEAGLRACKRCLPDAVPGSPQWNMRDDVAARSMRMIADGLVDRDGVNGLAAKLGYTPRHLGRILANELGAGPLALARAHRAQTARLLLTSTDLPVTDVAFAAGFGSIRQFNDTVLAVYQTTPSALREVAQARLARKTRHSETAQTRNIHDTALTLRLPAREPFDADEVFGFLAERTIAGIESGDRSHYARALRMPNGIATIDAAPNAETPGVVCDVRVSDVADLAPLVSRIRRLFDLDADARAIDIALSSDPSLAASVREHPGIRVPGSLDPDEILFRALIGQQVSVAGARTALSRLAATLGTELDTAPIGRETTGFTRLFPTAEQIARGAAEIIRGPRKRTETIVRVAERLAAGELKLDVGMSRDELNDSLLEIPGIGPWTAGYVAMRVLGSPDVLLVEDLALRNGAVRLGLPSEPRALARRGAEWAPWRSYAGMHLWRRTRA
jgi:AraC family transcriptional regulator of adaptative response / DNA-3-methyladenine glycosylase II